MRFSRAWLAAVPTLAPDCAHGHFLTYPVEVTLWRSRPVTSHPGERSFTRITMSETSPLWQGRP